MNLSPRYHASYSLNKASSLLAELEFRMLPWFVLFVSMSVLGRAGDEVAVTHQDPVRTEEIRSNGWDAKRCHRWKFQNSRFVGTEESLGK